MSNLNCLLKYNVKICSNNRSFQTVRIITIQLNELSSRLDNLEVSLKKDIHTILDLLHQQQQMQLHMHQQQQGHQEHQHSQQQPTGKPNSYQPSESDFSFDNLSTTTDNNNPHSQPASVQPTTQRNVQRSISEPEYTTNRSLFR